MRVVTTTSMVTDLVRKVGGDRVTVEGLMGPGVDPHLYKPGASDVVKLQRAQVIFYNGLLLEGKMTDLFERMAGSKRRVFALAEGLPRERLLTPEDFAGHPDPHIWFDVALWAETVPRIVAGLSEVDPRHASVYRENGDQARAELRKLHEWVQAKTAELPPERRVLITSHDAYNYFGRAYGFEVIGLQGISTVSEAGLADMAALVDLIKARNIRAIFVESSVPPGTIRRIAQDARVRVGGELFSDAMGQAGQIENGHDVGTYEGMIKHNVSTIVEALK